MSSILNKWRDYIFDIGGNTTVNAKEFIIDQSGKRKSVE